MSTAIEIYELSAGYWPHSCCIHVFMDQDGVEVHKLAEKEQVQYPAILTEQAWSIRDLLYLVSCYRWFFVSLKNMKNSWMGVLHVCDVGKNVHFFRQCNNYVMYKMCWTFWSREKKFFLKHVIRKIFQVVTHLQWLSHVWFWIEISYVHDIITLCLQCRFLAKSMPVKIDNNLHGN